MFRRGRDRSETRTRPRVERDVKLLTALLASLTNADRAGAVRNYIEHLDLAIVQSPLDAQDQVVARETDRQGLGPTRRADG